MLRQLPQSADPNLLSAAIPFADAGVYRISDELALVQSVDFFTPVVDDPFVYGQIAAANALSDIYAMGGRPITALNLIGFPKCLGVDMLTAVLQGGADKVVEAGAVIVGGHSVEDEEPKYGLAVTGLVDPRRMVTTVGARPGDQLLLTKPLGTGILTTALKGEVLTETDLEAAITGMATLNRRAAEIMLEIGVHACTDITGFGLLGHALELAEASEVCVTLYGPSLPTYPRTTEMAALGLIPGGSHRNRDHYLPRVLDAGHLPSPVLDLLADPQTSGGLFISVAAEKAAVLRDRLLASGCGAYVVGEIAAGPAGRLRVS
ncbi:selenide, water dikinase SelD [Geoalkalibacter halelectricus]|uniref:Selenide, water dikinase n=1 Tax=Geoalkalibacter halelectricus TaxID=2847045 RepID=A0ABY5ZP06_9BACT|nr:selenide, water dikinase SelD [Geoalkalibacter halelectricus]